MNVVINDYFKIRMLYSAADRLSFLQNSLEKCNNVLLQRVLRRGEAGTEITGPEMSINRENRNRNSITELFADYGIHYPLQLSSSEHVLRIIRFVADESVLLSSKERFPFLVFAEVLEMGYNGSDTRTFYQAEPNLNSIEVDSDLSDYSGDYPFDNEKHTLFETNPVSVMMANAVNVVTPQVKVRGGSHEDVSMQSQRRDAAHVRRMPTRPSYLKTNVFDKNRPMTPVNKKIDISEKSALGEVPKEQDDRYTSKRDLLVPLTWAQKKESIRLKSPYGRDSRWDVKAFIVKTGTTLRREVLAMQLINSFKDIFDQEKVDIVLKPYRILCTGTSSGFIEYLCGTQSVDNIKKAALQSQQVETSLIKSKVDSSSRKGLYGRRALRYTPPDSVRPEKIRFTGSDIYSGNDGSPESQIRNKFSLKDYFEATFGPSFSPMYAQALDNFVRSLAGYSLATYVLQVRQ